MGAIRLVGKHGTKDYKIKVSIPLIYTGQVQPVKITKKLTNSGKSSVYTNIYKCKWSNTYIR